MPDGAPFYYLFENRAPRGLFETAPASLLLWKVTDKRVELFDKDIPSGPKKIDLPGARVFVSSVKRKDKGNVELTLNKPPVEHNMYSPWQRP